MRIVLAIALILSACSQAIEPEKPVADWTAFKIPRLSLSLIDEDEIQQLWFVENDDVAITLGRRSASFTNPIFKYTVTPEKITILNEGKVVDELAVISASSKTLTARRKSGKIGRYKILPPYPKQSAAATH